MYSASSQFVCYFISIPFFSCGCAREHRLCRMECNQNETFKCNAHFTNLQKRHFLRFRNRSVKHLNIRIIICTLIVDYIYTYYINAMLCWEREEEKKIALKLHIHLRYENKNGENKSVRRVEQKMKKTHTQNHTQFDSFLLLHFNIIVFFFISSKWMSISYMYFLHDKHLFLHFIWVCSISHSLPISLSLTPAHCSSINVRVLFLKVASFRFASFSHRIVQIFIVNYTNFDRVMIGSEMPINSEACFI